MKTYTFTARDLNALLYNTIDMFVEYRDVHGNDETDAQYNAVREMLEGIEATIELVRNGVLSKDNAGMVIE